MNEFHVSAHKAWNAEKVAQVTIKVGEVRSIAKTRSTVYSIDERKIAEDIYKMWQAHKWLSPKQLEMLEEMWQKIDEDS